ncbi:GMC oxidoreductase [Cadophora sp. DSE1049]|nr:GMC oxidoreductase [Cadophora sp. DSE1049]
MVAMKSAYDFIVVRGTAGNVVAGRLASNPAVSILIIEAGPSNPRDIPDITTPFKAFDLRGSQYDWTYKTTMVDRPDYTRVEKPNTRGKVPGSAATFDDWMAFGGETWGWKGVEKYLKKPAKYFDDEGLYPEALKTTLASEEGILPASHSDLLPEMEPFRDALIKAWVSKGEKLTDDIYSGEMHGLAKGINTIHKGFQSSSYVFVENKPNVTILSSMSSKNLVFDGLTCTGVTVFGSDGEELTFTASREVIVSSGIYESPKLLMLSGLGPDEILKPLGIKTVLSHPHAGKSLLDHPILANVFKLKDGFGLEDHLFRAGPAKTGAIEAYRKHRTGPLNSGYSNFKAYREAQAENGGVDPFGQGGQPHFEIDFVPMFSDAFQWHIPTPTTGNWFAIIVDLLRPVSKPGQVKLNSTNPLEQPNINLNFLADDLDVMALREGVRFVDDILMNGEGMKDVIGEDYPWPVPRNSDAATDKMILERHQTGFHPCGTARLSKNIDEGVNLRVIDASVFFVIPDCRIQNAVYVVAEKGADMIKSDYPSLY